MTLNEKQLVSDAAAGDISAFEQLLFAYEKRIFYYLKRFFSRIEDAEDAAQETFFKAYRNLRGFDPAYNFSTWLHTIATRTAYEHLRKKRRQAPELFVLDDTDYADETSVADEAYNNIDKEADFQRLVNDLKPEYQAVLTLKYVEELSYEEIAIVLDKPLNTIRTYLHRAKAELAKKYEKK